MRISGILLFVKYMADSHLAPYLCPHSMQQKATNAHINNNLLAFGKRDLITINPKTKQQHI